MEKVSRIFLFSLLFSLFSYAQSVTGRVIDKVTQEPVETVAVYFDNTTIGTTTNSDGEFSITYSEAIRTNLVFSYLGYEKVIITDYRSRNNITVELIAATNTLDEVYINFDDGLTRRQKLRLFRKEFLGTSKFGKSCIILNEDDLVLRYDSSNKALYASSKMPIKVKNKALQYQVDFDIIDFEINYRYLDVKTLSFTLYSVTYLGTSFYTDLKNADKRKTLKNREQAYKGSVQHFMRSLYNKNLEKEGYWIFHEKFRVDEWSFFEVNTIDNSNFKAVKLKEKVSILYNKEAQSEMQLEVDKFFIDSYGNYTPIVGVYFSGVMGDQRVGDTLPSDYGLNN